MTGLRAVMGSWKIMAMREPRRRRNSSEGRVVRFVGRPSFFCEPFWKTISPVTMAAGGSRPMMASEVIDFPEPDSPTKPRTSPGAMEKETPLTAATGAAAFGCCPRDCGNSMVRPRTSSSGSTMSMVSAETHYFNSTPTTAVSLQSSLSKHLEKLPLRAHINRLRHQLSFAVVNKTFRDALHDKHFI